MIEVIYLPWGVKAGLSPTSTLVNVPIFADEEVVADVRIS